MSNRRRVIVSGIGLQTCLGVTPTSFFENLMEGVSGIRNREGLPFAAGWVDFHPAGLFTRIQLLGLDRVSQLAIAASEDAVRQSGTTFAHNRRCGVFFGTGMGGSGTLEQAYATYFKIAPRRRAMAVPLIMTHAPAAQVGIRHGIVGECQTYSSGCSSSSVAIGEAYRRIKDGYLDVALAGGSECMLQDSVMKEWNALGVLAKDQGDPSTGCRPFSVGRTGFHLSEGACVLVLEEMNSALKRGAPILAEIAGYGVSNDATHITKPDSAGQVAAMEAAMQDAGVDPWDIDYINAHGTATRVGDSVEVASIKDALGPRAYEIPVSGTKSAHGHAIGATAAIELAACILAVRHSAVPPTAFWTEADDDCDLDFVPGRGRAVDRLETVLSNSFAFGGNNSCLVVRNTQSS